MRKIISVLLIILAITGMALMPSKKNKVPFNANKFAEHFCDSLQRSGVDTVMIFRKNCVKCNTYKNEHPEKYFSLPVYIFWVNQGRYFITKADQLGKYNIIERKSRNQWPIYDFWNRKKEQIRNEVHITKKQGKTPVSDYVITREILDRKMETDETDITLLISGVSEKITNDQTYVMPLFPNNDSTLTLNSKITYYQNLILPRYEWERIIEAELFEIEFKRLWED